MRLAVLKGLNAIACCILAIIAISSAAARKQQQEHKNTKTHTKPLHAFVRTETNDAVGSPGRQKTVTTNTLL